MSQERSRSPERIAYIIGADHEPTKFFFLRNTIWQRWLSLWGLDARLAPGSWDNDYMKFYFKMVCVPGSTYTHDMIFSNPTGDALISQDGAVSFSADYVTTNATWVVMEDYANDMHVTACYIQHATSLRYLGCDDSE